MITGSSLSSNGRRIIIAADFSTRGSKRALSLASSSRSTTKWYMVLVRDIRRVGIKEDIIIASGVDPNLNPNPNPNPKDQLQYSL